MMSAHSFFGLPSDPIGAALPKKFFTPHAARHLAQRPQRTQDGPLQRVVPVCPAEVRVALLALRRVAAEGIMLCAAAAPDAGPPAPGPRAPDRRELWDDNTQP